MMKNELGRIDILNLYSLVVKRLIRWTNTTTFLIWLRQILLTQRHNATTTRRPQRCTLSVPNACRWVVAVANVVSSSRRVVVLKNEQRSCSLLNVSTILWWGKGVALLLVLGLWACDPDDKKEEPKPDTDLITGTYTPEDYVLNIPKWMPPIPTTASNPLTKAGVALGRMLFYDPILSRDSTQSCASCHQQAKGFTDGLATSPGIRGQNGTRSAMPLVNLAYNTRGFFWDGRSVDLEGQALLPIEDHLEMDDTWDNVERKLRRHKDYPGQFRQAFGISRKTELTRDLVVKALSQFERTLISAYSRYDRLIWAKEDFPTDEEQRGLELFFIEYAGVLAHPGCSHCHFNPLFTDNNYHNNGLDNVPNLAAFKDLGRGKVTGLQSDNGRFRTPSLRNVALSAPYMHDGRFKTLEEVLENYSRGGHGVANEDANITGFPLSEQDKSDLIAFLKMLTDTSFVNNPAFSNPFKR